MRKPTILELQRYLKQHNPLDLRDAELSVVGEHNHLIYRAEKDGKVYAIRMINPESYRSGEWISMAEEFAVLRALEHTELGPKVYYIDEQFSPPLIIQEFVGAKCFNNLKPLSNQHLVGAARAIAELNAQDITPEKLPFLAKYTEESFQRRAMVWYYRLFDAVKRARRKDVLKWALKIAPVCLQARRCLACYEYLFRQSNFVLHFDGAHCGNTYWRNGKVMFLDWQKVSYRNDPTFTLVRFMTSAGGEKGRMSEQLFETLVSAYLEVRLIPNFDDMARSRLLERQMSDLIWVLWDYSRRKDKRPVEEATSVASRYEEVKKMLRTY